MHCRILIATVVAVSTVMLSGCATAGQGAADSVLCQQDSLDRAMLDTRMPVDDLDDDARAIVDQGVYDDGTAFVIDEDWFVGRASAEEVILLRERHPTAQDEDPREYERATISWLDDRWMVTAHGRCDLTVDLGAHSVPDVALDPASDPTTTEVKVLVTERDCNSGEDAAGRVDLISLDERDDRVTIVVGIRPHGGAAACPTNPATPFTVTLAEPLGDRTLYDGTRAPARQLTVGD